MTRYGFYQVLRLRSMPQHLLFLLSLCFLTGSASCASNGATKDTDTGQQPESCIATDSSIRTIHVMVALCDNTYQGIVPVPATIGNGQDPDNNLYWGCAYGVRSFFRKSKDWRLVKKYKLNDTILERLIFRSTRTGYYLVADAYNGRRIKECTEALLRSGAGIRPDTVRADGKILGIGSRARLLAYIGHDGLMDFKLDRTYENTDGKERDLIILACYSKRFFAAAVRAAGCHPLLWSTGLMSPEAYTLHDALDAYVQGKSPADVRLRAAGVYARYQRCSSKAAMNLLVTGY